MTSIYEYQFLREALSGVLRPGGLKLTQRALTLSALEAGDLVVDAGCGAGATLGFLRQNQLEAQGIEISSTLADIARQFGPVTVADYHKLPLDDNLTEAIFCECSLSLSTDKRAAVSEFYRVLKPGGRLIISDLIRLNRERAPEMLPVNDCATGALTAKELTELLSISSFKLVHEEYFKEALRNMAAQILWHCGSQVLKDLLCSTTMNHNYTYGLFIAKKSGEK